MLNTKKIIDENVTAAWILKHHSMLPHNTTVTIQLPLPHWFAAIAAQPANRLNDVSEPPAPRKPN